LRKVFREKAVRGGVQTRPKVSGLQEKISNNPAEGQVAWLFIIGTFILMSHPKFGYQYAKVKQVSGRE
jgi:hypothetical protein